MLLAKTKTIRTSLVHHRVSAVLDSGGVGEQERDLKMEIHRFCSSGSPGQLDNRCPGLVKLPWTSTGTKAAYFRFWMSFSCSR